MIDKRTVITEDSRADKNMGVSIDIFPSDYLDDTYLKKYDKILKRCSKNRALIEHLGSKIGFNRSFSLKYMLKLIFRAALAPFKMAVFKRCDTQFSKKSNGKYCANFVYNIYNKRNYYPADLWDDLAEYDFEDFKIPGYRNYDAYLTVLYGDYMKLPPEEQRISHHSFTAYRKIN